MSSSTDQIRQSLMKIKQSQADLLRELRSQHDALQGYMGVQHSSFDAHSNKASPIIGINGYGQNNEYHSFQSSLQLSKSQGNTPNYRNLAYKSTSTGAQDILQNNYKKIQQLLMKQRKMYEQNHALQQQNQSLNEDYRTLKKILYEHKQANKDNLIIFNFVMSEIISNGFKDLLLEVPNSEIITKTKKIWQKFKIEHPKLFQQAEKGESFCEQVESQMGKIFSLLDQDFKINTIKSKEEEILQLKQKISYLINMNSQVSKNKQQMYEIQEKRIVTMEKQNYKLSLKIKQLQRQLNQKSLQGVSKLKELQANIIGRQQLAHKYKELLQQKQQQIQKIRTKAQKYKNKNESTHDMVQQMKQQAEKMKEKIKQKETLYQNQLELNKKQNITMEKLTRDINQLRNQLVNGSNVKNQQYVQLLNENANLVRQLTALKQQYIRSRQIFQKEINSLVAHNKQIKNQHAMLIKSEENARVSEMRYKEMVMFKGNQIKMTNNVDHLWSVKQIQYGNLIGILNSFK